MNRPDEQPTLEDVLDTYLTAVEEPDLRSAREWRQRFPQYAEAIQDFVVSWKLATGLPANPHVRQPETAAFLERGRSLIADVFRRLQEEEQTATTGPSIDTLLSAAKARGIGPGDLAVKLDVSIPLVGKLNRRLIEPASIPRELIEALALNLGYEQGSISRYLAQPPTITTGTFHRAAGKPTIAAREDFETAVRTDSALTPGQRARWLSLAVLGR